MRRLRRSAAGLVGAVCVLVAGCTTGGPSAGPTTSPAVAGGTGVGGTTTVRATGAADPRGATVSAVVRDVMAQQHLRAAIVKVTVDGTEVLRQAYGESMPGVPATTDMHFRNGAVAISYVSTLLLQLVDAGTVRLDDVISRWVPEIPYADQVTLRQLAQMTSGYADYVQNPDVIRQLYDDPWHTFTPEELVAAGTRTPLAYPPGTNWNYSHTDYVILGLVLEKITGKSVDALMQEKVLGPLGLTGTTDPGTPAIPEPALHAYTSERREHLGIPAATPFVEDSTYWNPSWTITRGAVQTTTIDDLNATAVAIGTGKLLSPASYQAMTTKELIGRTSAVPGCATCAPMAPGYTYGLGLVSSGSWLLQNPLFAGEGGAFAFLPTQKVAIAVVTTFLPEALAGEGAPKNSADLMWRRIAAALVPAEAPQIPRGLQ